MDVPEDTGPPSDKTTVLLMEHATKARLERIAEMRRWVHKENSRTYPAIHKDEVGLVVSPGGGGMQTKQSGKQEAANSKPVDELRPKEHRSKIRIEQIMSSILHGKDDQAEEMGGDASAADSKEQQARARAEKGSGASSPIGQRKKKPANPVSISKKREDEKAKQRDQQRRASILLEPIAAKAASSEPLNKFMRAMSEEERMLVTTVFRFMDINGDNVLEFGEIKEMFKVLGVSISARELDQMIKQVDGDGDHAVSEGEFLVMIGMAKLGLVAEGLGKVIFDHLRNILDLAKHAESRIQAGIPNEGPDAIVSPLHSLRTNLSSIKLAKSKSFREKKREKLQSEQMLLDWRTDEEKKKAALQARERERAKNVSKKHTSQATADAAVMYKRAKEKAGRRPSIVISMVPWCRPSLLEGTDIPTPRLVPKWDVVPKTDIGAPSRTASTASVSKAAAVMRAARTLSGELGGGDALRDSGSPPSAHSGMAPAARLSSTARPPSGQQAAGKTRRLTTA